MALIEVLMPAMGEGIIEATLISWFKNEGEPVELDENLVEVATDKVNSEVPSTVKGILQKKLFNDNDVIPVGKAFAIIATEGTEAETPSQNPVSNTTNQVETKSTEESVQEVLKPVTVVVEKELPALTPSGDRFYSPLVMNIAKEENMTSAELDAIPGTGKDGRVTKDDMMSYLQSRNNSNNSTPTVNPSIVATNNNISNAAPVVETAVNNTYGANVEVVKMDRMRKLIADYMVKSVQTSPHVCSFVEADMTNIVAWRNKNKNKFKEKYGQNLTYTPILIEAVARALRDFPIVNSSLDGDNIIIKKDINIGMAAALPSGNLIVPVIKNADQLNLMGLATKVNDLGRRAKDNQLKPDEIQGGTYTLTNLGSFGNLFGTPIINQPQVAIIGVGAIVKKPVVIETPQGDTIGIRSTMYLSHSYDHRVIDGMVGGSFVKRVAEYLEGFDMNREV